ncbi:MAG: hypothetical protein K0Q77_7 [Anaerosporomusa subterranea]|jgi:hypothetical protein|nr:hypothetical protein [Anaerosporomusa subterranea]
MTQKQGLQLFDANGNLMLEVTDTLTRFLGTVDTDAVSSTGSFTDNRIIGGKAWITFHKTGANDYRDANFAAWCEGNQIKWQHTAGMYGSRIKSYRIYYGAY